MGSPLSPVMANLYMEYYESELLPTLPLRPSMWLRYVDDVFAIWPHDQAEFPAFLDALNALAPSINFKVEWGVDGVLPFLDARVHQMDGRYSFSVYRKPMHSGMYIHFFSYHPLRVKKSVSSSLFLRALRICDPQHLDAELAFLRTSFTRLAYPKHVLDQALSQAKRTFYTGPRTRPDQRQPTLCSWRNSNVSKAP